MLTYIMIKTQWTILSILLFWWLSFKLDMRFVPCDIKHSHIAQTLMAANNLCNIQIHIYGNIRWVTRILDLGCFLSFLSISKDKAIQQLVCGHIFAPPRMSHSSCLATRRSQVCTAFHNTSGTGWTLILFILVQPTDREHYWSCFTGEESEAQKAWPAQAAPWRERKHRLNTNWAGDRSTSAKASPQHHR